MSEPLRSVSGSAVSRGFRLETEAIAQRLANAALHRDPTVLHHAVSVTVSSVENLLQEANRHSVESQREAQEILDCVKEAVLLGNNTGFTRANQAALEFFGVESVEELNQEYPKIIREMGFSGEPPFAQALKGACLIQNLWVKHPVLGKPIFLRSIAHPGASWMLVELDPPIPSQFRETVLAFCHRLTSNRESALAAFVFSLASFTALWFYSSSDWFKVLLLAPALVLALFLANALRLEFRSGVQARARADETEKSLEKERIIKDTLVSALTHDLQGPISAARLSAQTLLRFPERVRTHQKMTARIVGSLDRADRMIRDLLDATRIRAGQRLPIQTEQIDLTELASTTLEEMMMAYGERFRLFADRQVIGYWSRDGLRRVIENLIVNAVRYGHPEKPITTSIEQTSTEIVLKVHNEGKELSPGEQKTLFHFMRRPSQVEQSGWGIGLVLVRGLIEAHGGSVSVDSTSFKGTTFAIRVPKDGRRFETF